MLSPQDRHVFLDLKQNLIFWMDCLAYAIKQPLVDMETESPAALSVKNSRSGKLSNMMNLFFWSRGSFLDQLEDVYHDKC